MSSFSCQIMDSSIVQTVMDPTSSVLPGSQQTGPEVPVTIHELLERSPYAIRALTEKQVGRSKFPDHRVSTVMWICFRKSEAGEECRRINVYHRGQCLKCKQSVVGETNIFMNADKQAVKWGDELNIMPGRLLPKWWECRSCGHLHQVAGSTIGESRCPGCEVDGIVSAFSGDCWLWNGFSERLGLCNGSILLEMGPWMDTIWAYHTRKRSREDVKIIV